MKRQRVKHATDRVYVDNLFEVRDVDLPMSESKLESSGKWIEAQVLPGDTLQAIALRFSCTIAELKKVNKIDKDNEIFARRIIRVPITPHSILLETLPKVHTSGSSSPKNTLHLTQNSTTILENDANFDEKLLVAAVSSASYKNENLNLATEHNVEESSEESIRQPLLSGEYDDSLPQPRLLRLPANDYSCNGSDCDISWICLLLNISKSIITIILSTKQVITERD
ncbi:lysM and putative peptidoglycan-binding domain-containing protein 4 isoform X2 [Wyeomyia smithii]|uniref:lysM and putative peptidoglycan-binding domain-containing protein 4 isoform X2 n=1 Tax=Wyeomyia smithii TaxID=174621 RepID=UPI002467DB6F|nr:lysM and putative peptidoglycan-binding domain-containing protein 4 isoform X2 [Wyeomyia smithii]